MRWMTGFFFVLPCTLAAAQNAGPVLKSPQLAITRLYTGADGQSHFDQVPVTARAAGLASESSDPLKMADAFMVRGAPGFFQPWHNADKKRYIVVLSGEAEIRTTTGASARLVPGRLYLAEDLTGKGHTFRVIGDRDWVALFVNFAQ